VTGEAPVALNWQVNGLRLAGLAWGDPSAKPLLALHGWLDNAASFSQIAPLLEGYYVVAVDLTGHGRSAHRSADAGYQIWDDLPELVGVIDALGWDRFCLMGHSRGAIIAGLLASALPERVDRLVLLDGLSPPPVAEAQFPAQMRKFLDEKRYWAGRSNRVYPSVEAAVASRAREKLPEEAARLLVERNLVPCEGGFTWTTDLRLRGASAVKLTRGQIRAVWEALTMPTLLLLAQRGVTGHAEQVAEARRHIRQLDVAEVTGGHHFHMEPETAAVAQHICRFLQARGNQENDDKR